MSVLPTTTPVAMPPLPPPPPAAAPPVPPPPAPSRSLWQELSDGTAGWGVRLVANLAVGVFLVGAVPIGAYAIASLFPQFNRGVFWGLPSAGLPSRAVYPRDELVGWLAGAAGAALLAASVWLWCPPNRRRPVWRPTLYTIAIVTAAAYLCAWADRSLRGENELVIFGLLFVAAAALLLVWLQAARAGSLRRGRPVRNADDGLPDVRCPACDYRMVGLTESRCPECGAAYTLDELLARQRFERPAAPSPR